MQSVGARINNLLNNGFYTDMSALGNFDTVWLRNATTPHPYKIQYADNTAGFILLHFQFPNSFANRTIAQLSAQASKPGVAFQALQAAINASAAPVVIDTSAMDLRPAPARKLADTAAPGTPGTITAGTKVIGSYGIWDPPQGKRFAIWKLNDFSLSELEYFAPWQEFVAMATAANVDRLIIDLSGNGGGSVSTGYTGVALLYPELLKPDAKPWVNTYSRHYGPAALYLEQNGLDAKSVLAEFNKVLKTDLITNRAAYLSSNVTALQELMSITANVLHAIDVLVMTSSDNAAGQVICSEGGDCASLRNAWQLTLGQLSVNVTAQALAPNLTTQQLASYMATLASSLASFAPFFQYYRTPASPLNATNIYDTPISLSVAGGKEWRTTKYYMNTAQDLIEMLKKVNATVPQHPFKQILVASNGLCGSTCDTFARTAWVYR